MGTRADFYIGKGQDAEWLGSIAFDGYLEGIPDRILLAVTPDEFRTAVQDLLSERRDASLPSDGWPWPWDNSRWTDCSYWFFEGQVWHDIGQFYSLCSAPWPDDGDHEGLVPIHYPDMSKLERRPLLGAHSGVIAIVDGKMIA